MHVLVVGLNHKVAPVEIREKLALGGECLSRSLSVLSEYAGEGAILSTCNRTEVYAVVGHVGSGEQNLRRFLSHAGACPREEFDAFLYVKSQEDAVTHLFSVASGLDSMVLGEPQIMGQVAECLEHAQAAGTAGPVLSRLFRQALTAGKRARTETEIARSAVSVSYAAVELAKKIFKDLRSCRVLVIGAGETGELTAKTLVDCGAGKIAVANRTGKKAEELAEKFGGATVDFGRIDEALASADIVISSTGAPEPIVTPDLVTLAMRTRRNRPLFLIDIAVPRDVAPSVSDLENVYVYDIDDLQSICTANMDERRREVARVDAIVSSEVTRFIDWWHTLDVVPTIAALRNRAEDIRQAELSRVLGKLDHLSERDRNAINALTQSIVNKLLHVPTVRLKERGSGNPHARVLRDLFALDEES